jgi:ABC-2 type transport system permease protein
MREVYRGLWVVAYRELLRFTHDRSRLFGSVIMPLLFLLIFGLGFNRIIGTLTPGVDYLKFVFPGMMTMNVLILSLMSGLSVVWDREFGFLKEILVAPLSRTGIALGKAVGGAAVALIPGLLMVSLAPFLGLSLTPLLVLQLIPMLAIIAVSLAGVGVLIASRMRSQQGFQILMPFVVLPMIFLSGAFFPVSGLPPWLTPVVLLNPATYGIDAIRQVVLGNALTAAPPGLTGAAGAILGVSVFGHTMGIWEDLVLISLLGSVVMVAAVWSFNRQD